MATNPDDQRSASSRMAPEDAFRAATRINDALLQVGVRRLTEWWEATEYSELGGRTPEQAWLIGMHGEVFQLAQAQVSRRFARALSVQPDVARRLLDARS